MDTTSLRWRAGVAKAAAASSSNDEFKDDDVDDDMVEADETSVRNRTREVRRPFFCCCCRHWQDGLAVAAIASSFLSLYISPHSPLVNVASILTIFIALLLSYQSRKLKSSQFRIIANALRHEVNYCQVERERLHRTLTRLESRMDQVHAIETELFSMYDPTQLTKLTRIVQDRGAIHQQMNRILQHQVIQTTMKVVVHADADQDGHVGPNEMELLVLKLQHLPGVQFDEYQFRAKMAAGDRSLRTVMDIMRDLDDSDVFQFRPGDLTPKDLLLDVR